MPDSHLRFALKQSRFKQLRAFCYTAQTHSMSKAAEQMFLSQPSISLLIQSLEKDLGEKLFLRRGPRILLTAEGATLFSLALPLVEGLETLPQTFHEQCRNQISGDLTIAAGESSILYLLPDIIKVFSDKYPHIQIKLNNVSGNEGLAQIRAGEADFAVGSILNVPKDIFYLPIYNFEPMLITPNDHPLLESNPVTIQDIARYGLILSPQHQSTRQMVDLVFQQFNSEYNVVIEAGGWEVTKKYVECGLGISIVNDICLSGKEQLASIPLGKYFPKRSYGIFLRNGTAISPAARRFITIMDTGAVEKYQASEQRARMQAHPA